MEVCLSLSMTETNYGPTLDGGLAAILLQSATLNLTASPMISRRASQENAII